MNNHIFKSRSQHIINVMYKGRRYKVRFSTPYMGAHSSYSTTDEELAEAIKQSPAYRQGLISHEVKVVADVQAAPAKKAERMADEKPLWAQRSMKRATEAAGMPAGQPAGTVAETAGQPAGTVAETAAAAVTETAGNAAGAVEEELFRLEIGDVENYMDAKAYLRDTLGVDADKIKNKEQVVAYCQEKGIVFPNYEMK